MPKKTDACVGTCFRSELRDVCKLLDEAGVPPDPKWTSLIMYLRSLKYNEALSTSQKGAVQELFLDILRSRDFSDERYREVALAQEHIVASPYMQKLQLALSESAQLVRDFGTLLERRRGDVQDLGDFTVKTVSGGTPPDQAVRSLREAFHKLVQALDEDVRTLETVARTDDLTGLANRRGLDERLDACVTRVAADNTPLSLLMLDIDLFKNVNDTYGHQVGDHVLRAVARHMAEEAGEASGGTAFCARYGGEEFVVLLDGQGLARAGEIAERIRERVSRVAFDLSAPGAGGKKTRVQCTVSIGVCQVDPHWGDMMVQRMLDCADAALYEAKRSGRNKVVCFGEGGTGG